MDREFLECANDTELRLETEGFFLTAQAMRQVISTYILDHTESKTNDLRSRKQENKTGLTQH
jgi:hypothetical protein